MEIKRLKDKSYGFAAFLTLALCALKPFIDSFWILKLSFFSITLNAQSIVAMLFSCVALFVSLRVLLERKYKWERISACFFLVLLFVLALSILRKTCSLEFSLKYLSSAAGFFLIPWASRYVSNSYLSLLRKCVLFSVVWVVFGAVLQWSGLLHWHASELLFNFSNPQSHLIPINRLTSFYYHPLDLMRVLIWVWIYMVFQIITGAWGVGNYVWLMGFQGIFLRTTHRISLVWSLVLLIVTAFHHRKMKRGLCLVVGICMTWGLFVGLIQKTENVNFLGIISPVFQSGGSTTYFPEKTSDQPIGKTVDVHLRGRTIWWKEHLHWIQGFNTSEWLLGTSRIYPENQEAEPHQQFLDWIEKFGFIGLVLFLLQFLITVYFVESSVFLKVQVTATLLVYSMMTEVWVAPTWIWWANGLLIYPILKQRIAQ